MNNAKLTNTLTEESPVDIKPMLRQRQEKLAKIVQAIDSVYQSEHWKFLEKEVFQASLDSTVNQLCVEENDRKAAKLQGQILVLSKYADFKRFSDEHRMQLKSIEEQLKRS